MAEPVSGPVEKAGPAIGDTTPVAAHETAPMSHLMPLFFMPANNTGDTMPRTIGEIKRERGFERRVDRRESAAKRGYGNKWKKARQYFLRSNPLCIECLRDGTIKQANVVDHIKPHKGDYNLMWDKSNWQALCTSCHSRKTVKHDGGFGFKSND